MNIKIVAALVAQGLLALIALGVAWGATSSADEALTKLSESEESRAALEVRVKSLEQRVARADADVGGAAPDGSPSFARAGDTSTAPRVRTKPGSLPGPEGVRARRGPRDANAPVDTLLSEDAEPEVREKIQGMVRDTLAIEREERHQRRVERMKERVKEDVAEFAQELSLDEATQEQLTTQLTSEREKVMAMWHEGREQNTPRDEMRAKMDAVRAETDQEVSTILSEDDFKEYSTMRAEEAERFRGRGGRGRGGRGGRGGNR